MAQEETSCHSKKLPVTVRNLMSQEDTSSHISSKVIDRLLNESKFGFMDKKQINLY
jgi:hypothetical protein